jgi:hypothetical protein
MKFLGALVFLHHSAAHLSGDIDASSFHNLIVVPDIHGDKDSFLRSLWISFNEVERESVTFPVFADRIENPSDTLLSMDPGNTVLIQLGDVMDRGPQGLECLDILDKIERTIGWRLIRLYGNHEILCHRGKSDSYIHPEEVVTFRDRFDHPDARWTEFRSGGSVWRRITDSSILMARIGPSEDAELTEDGLLALDSSSTLFVHGGIDTHWVESVDSDHHLTGSLVEALNRIAHDAVTSGSDIEMFETRSSPLWTRDLSQMNQEYMCKKLLPRVLKKFNVARIVVGHTPQTDRLMKSLCHSRFILADATMSGWMFMPKAAGNPTALVMRQNNGAISSLKAIYGTGTGNIFYRKDIGGMDFKPTPLHRNPSSVDIQGDATSSTFMVRVQLEGTGQRLSGAPCYHMIQSMQTKRPLHSFSLPLVTYLSPMGSDADGFNFFVIYDTYGASLKSQPDITIAIRRQMLEALRDLWNGGYSVAFSVFDTPRDVLDLYVMDSVSLLVKFVDFEKVSIRTKECDLHKVVGPVVSQLSLLESADPSETISGIVLVGEVFGDLVDLSRISNQYISGAQASPIRPIVGSYFPPLIDDELIEGSAEDVHDSVWIQSDVTYAPREWKVLSFEVIKASLDGSVCRAKFHETSDLGIEEGIIVKIESIPYAPALPVLMTAVIGSEGPGILPVAAAHTAEDDQMFVVFRASKPQNLVSLADFENSPESRMAESIVNDILEVTQYLHSKKISFKSDDLREDLGRLFLVDQVNGHAWFWDLSEVTHEPLSPDGFFEQKLDEVVQAVKAMFPNVQIVDTSPKPALVHSSTKKNQRRGSMTSSPVAKNEYGSV